MKINKTVVQCVGAIVVGLCLILPFHRPVAANSNNVPMPAIIQNGFSLWPKGGVDVVFDCWKKGGFMEDANKPGNQARFFKQLDRSIGSFKSYEPIEFKMIGPSSQIVYLAVNFEKGAVFGRYLLYRADKNWVIQNMDFSIRPEGLMPWLAFDEGKASE